MAEFDWVTEDEHLTLGKRERQLTPAASVWKRWRRLIIIVAVLLLAGVLVYLLLERQAATTIAAIEADVLASHRLAEQAMRQGDVELLRSLLSARDLHWSETQQRLAQTADPIWNLIPLDEMADLQGLILADDLRQAELTLDRRFSWHGDQIVTLRQTAVYRLGADQWLFAPPLDEFWGEEITEHIGRFNLTYRERDHELVEKLAARLEPELLTLCRELAGLTCSPSWVLDLHFTPDPLLLVLGEPPLNAVAVHLPAPSLLGEPLDEAGWDALTAGYLAWLSPIALTDMVGWQCCAGLMLHEMLLTYQLAQLGRRDWPLTAADYNALLAEPPPLSLFADNWNHFPGGDAEYWLKAMAFTEYLLTAVPRLPPAVLQSRLNGSSSFEGYLWSLGLTEAGLAAGWYAFLGERAYQPETFASVPEAAVQLLCQNNDGRDLLLRWSLDQARPEIELADRQITQLRPLPDTGGVLLVELQGAPRQSSYYSILLHQAPHQPRTILAGIPNSNSLNIYEQPNPTQGQLVLYTFDAEHNRPIFEQVDLNQCTFRDDCALTDIAGLPVWSPDGRQALIMQLRRGVLSLVRQSADLEERPVQLGNGWSPFWLSNTEFGFLRPQTVNQGGALRTETHLVTAVAGVDRARMLADNHRIMMAIPPDLRPEVLPLSYAMTSPARNNHIFIVGSHPPTGDLYLLVLDSNSDTITLIAVLPGLSVAYPPIRFAPDGRWLTINAFLRDGTRSLFWLYNIDEEKVQTFYFPLIENQPIGQWLPHWTVDGHWLLLPQGDHLAVFRPDSGYQNRHYYEDDLHCTAAVWVQQGE